MSVGGIAAPVTTGKDKVAKERLSPATFVYLAAVTLLGATGALLTIEAGPISGKVDFVVLCALTVILGSRTVRLWSTVEMSVALPFIYAGLLELGPASATFVALLAALGACLVRARRLNLARVLFNTSVIAGTTVAAAWVYLICGGGTG